MAYTRRSGYRRSYRRPAVRRSYPMYRRAPARRRAAPVRRTRRAAPRKARCVCPPAPMSPGDKWALAQVDPFNPAAFGGKIPDSNTLPSCSVALNEIQFIPLVAATDFRCFAFLPRVTRGRMISSTGGAAAWTWPAGYGGNSSFSKASDYTAAYDLDRPVAHAIRISSSLPPTTAQGFVHIAIAFEAFADQTTWPWPTTVAGLSNYQFYKRVTLASLTQSPLVVVNKYMDETAFRYSSPADIATPAAAGAETGTFMTFQTYFSWGAILVAVEGVNSVSPINAEILLHTEAIPKSTGAVIGTPAAVGNGAVMGATSYMVSNTPESFTQQEHDGYLQRAQNAFQSGLQQAGSYAEAELGRRGRGLANQLFNQAIGLGVNFLAGGAPGLPGINQDANRLMLQH